MTALPRGQLVTFLGEMLLIRRFEEKVTLEYVYAPTRAPKALVAAERQV